MLQITWKPENSEIHVSPVIPTWTVGASTWSRHDFPHSSRTLLTSHTLSPPVVARQKLIKIAIWQVKKSLFCGIFVTFSGRNLATLNVEVNRVGRIARGRRNCIGAVSFVWKTINFLFFFYFFYFCSERSPEEAELNDEIIIDRIIENEV